jgi:hypothetical protein
MHKKMAKKKTEVEVAEKETVKQPKEEKVTEKETVKSTKEYKFGDIYKALTGQK